MKKYVKELESEQGKKFDKIILQTSPFVRCMATAARIAKPLKLRSVQINYRMSEWQVGCYNKDNPMTHLEFKSKSAACLNRKYKLLGIDYQDTSEYWKQVNKLFPEDFEKGLKRVSQSYNWLKGLRAK